MFEGNKPLRQRSSGPWILILYLNVYNAVQRVTETSLGP